MAAHRWRGGKPQDQSEGDGADLHGHRGVLCRFGGCDCTDGRCCVGGFGFCPYPAAARLPSRYGFRNRSSRSGGNCRRSRCIPVYRFRPRVGLARDPGAGTRRTVHPRPGSPNPGRPDGENLLFKAPYGGRSTPVILGDRLFLQRGVGDRETRQEQLVALDAGTGELLWEARRNIYHSDAPPRRVGWASPAVDAETGTVYFYTLGGGLSALDARTGVSAGSAPCPRRSDSSPPMGAHGFAADPG